ncbi:MAG: DUF4838 domain-containing protein [Clostridia bacterium]|nr:DUF4838 domain-containing protein [Clostridia bacterium]MBQ3603854.1 DUF4838 domain-containing protein [Clostridia bacterium]
MEFVKALICFLEVFFLSIFNFPSSSQVDYGGGDYVAPAVTTPMYIAKDGKTDFVIVTADGADACIMNAVDELQTYLEKICGAEFEHITESEYAGAKAIILGETNLGITDTEPASIGEDGFLLYSNGNQLVILGEDSRGTLYGVYTFLEEYLGVRWFTPTLEVVPESEDIVIDAAIYRIVEPSFVLRRNACPGTNKKHYARNRINVTYWDEMKDYGGALTYVLWDVTLDTLVPDSLFAEHPEYFAMNPDGTRTTDHVCLSHPDVLPIAVANAREAILNCPRDSKYIHIGQKDNSNYCHCETCESLYEKYGAVSAPTIIFTNSFADALDDEFPDFTFTFYAYGETDRPPKDLTLTCNPNVVPVLCGLHKACRSHKLTECGAQDGNETFQNLYGENEPTIAQDFADWVKIADRTFIYDYTINFLNSAQFFSNLETMQHTMKYMYDIGITGFTYNCGDGHSAAFNELRNYLLCKLQWDVNADVEYHMMDFMNAYYGEAAAPYLKEILDIQAAQIKATAHAFDFDWHYQSGFYPIHTISKLDGLWKKALSADATDEQMFNIEVANLSWEYFKANQLLGEYFFLNPGRLKANEELYDAFKAHNIDRVSSFGLIPENKEDVDFMLRPFNWK